MAFTKEELATAQRQIYNGERPNKPTDKEIRCEDTFVAKTIKRKSQREIQVVATTIKETSPVQQVAKTMKKDKQ